MALFVVTQRWAYALKVTIIRADSEDEIPPLEEEDERGFTEQTIQLLEIEGEKGEVYSRWHIE